MLGYPCGSCRWHSFGRALGRCFGTAAFPDATLRYGSQAAIHLNKQQPPQPLSLAANPFSVAPEWLAQCHGRQDGVRNVRAWWRCRSGRSRAATVQSVYGLTPATGSVSASNWKSRLATARSALRSTARSQDCPTGPGCRSRSVRPRHPPHHRVGSVSAARYSRRSLRGPATSPVGNPCPAVARLLRWSRSRRWFAARRPCPGPSSPRV